MISILCTVLLLSSKKFSSKESIAINTNNNFFSLSQVDCVDLYQIHGPIHLRSVEVLGDALAEAVKLGLTKTVGVSNYSTAEIIRMYNCLQKHGIQLASNQVEYSLIRRLPESSGLIAVCHKRGVAVLGYCPLVSKTIIFLINGH